MKQDDIIHFTGVGASSKSKYHNQRTEINGIVFASKKEARRYQELCLLLHGGMIRDLQCQPKFPIVVNGRKVCTYIADFQYFDCENKCLITEDVKSPATRTVALYRLKKKLVEATYGITVIEV